MLMYHIKLNNVEQQLLFVVLLFEMKVVMTCSSCKTLPLLPVHSGSCLQLEYLEVGRVVVANIRSYNGMGVPKLEESVVNIRNIYQYDRKLKIYQLFKKINAVALQHGREELTQFVFKVSYSWV